MRNFGVSSPTPAPADIGCSCGCLALMACVVFWLWIVVFFVKEGATIGRFLGGVF